MTPRERPIPFSGPMVRALLAGKKTQTRRVITDQPVKHPEGMRAPSNPFVHADGITWGWMCGEVSYTWNDVRCPYGKPGDRLWVRETWLPDPPINGWSGEVEWIDGGRPASGVPEEYRTPSHCVFAASWLARDPKLKWKPWRHMPRWASRATLELSKVRVEPLQTITEEDVAAEGSESAWRDGLAYVGGVDPRVQVVTTRVGSQHVFGPRERFATLWNSLNEKRGFGSMRELAFGNYDYARRAFRFMHPQRFDNPVAVRGALGIWALDDPELVALVKPQLVRAA